MSNFEVVVICYSSYRKVLPLGVGGFNLPPTYSVKDFYKHV